jgi:hypothetical protein
MSNPPASDLELRQLPDSPDARRFVELSSYAADLGEAHAALDLALRGFAEGEPLMSAHAHLVGYAAIAYCRVFFPSKVRPSLDARECVPAEFTELHELITDYRNRRVAHAQSQLSSTFAFIGLDSSGIRPSLIALTPAQELPAAVLTRWQALMDHVSDTIADRQRDVESRIIASLGTVDLDEIRSSPSMPELNVRPTAEFTARTSRGRYPNSYTLFRDGGDQAG